MKHMIQPRVDDILAQPGTATALPPSLTHSLENFFGANLADVSVHVDERLPARGILALAGAGQVHVAPHAFAPYDQRFEALMAHEFAHVLQQRAGLAMAGSSAIGVLADEELECQADDLATLFSVVQHAGMGGHRNLALPLGAMPARAAASIPVAQCVMIHAKDAIRKVDWIGGGYTQSQADSAKKIIEDNRANGRSSLTVTGLNSNKYGHESTGQQGENARTSSVTVWWGESLGSPIKSGHDTIRNSLADAIRVCGLGTHDRPHKGKPAYHLLWRVSAGLADRFYLEANKVTLVPAPK